MKESQLKVLRIHEVREQLKPIAGFQAESSTVLREGALDMIQGSWMTVGGVCKIVDGYRQLEISIQLVSQHGEIRNPEVIYMVSECRGH